MPRTEQEYEKEIAELTGKLNSLTQEFTKMKGESEQKVSHAVKNAEDLATQLKSYKDKERTDLETEVHSLNPKLEVKGVSDDNLKSWIKGFKEAKELIETASHATDKQAPDIPNQGKTQGNTKKNIPEVDKILNG